MPKFLWQVTYTIEGARGLASEGGTARREAIKEMLERAGGRLEAFYYAFGADDLVVIGELPDHATAAGFSLATAASGAAHSRATVLLAPEEIDRAAQLDGSYSPPGSTDTN